MTGIEPASSVWKTEVLTITPHSHGGASGIVPHLFAAKQSALITFQFSTLARCFKYLEVPRKQNVMNIPQIVGLSYNPVHPVRFELTFTILFLDSCVPVAYECFLTAASLRAVDINYNITYKVNANLYSHLVFQ